MKVLAMDSTSNSSPLINLLPERPGQRDCAFFLRTGTCRFGSNCRFNHPGLDQRQIMEANHMVCMYAKFLFLSSCVSFCFAFLFVAFRVFLSNMECMFSCCFSVHHTHTLSLSPAFLNSTSKTWNACFFIAFPAFVLSLI